MDIELARTFLEIVRSGSFIAAAQRLHVTQTTVTARVSNLEEQLRCRLFIRNRSGARLTADGERFSLYALQLVQIWDKARLDLPLPRGHSTVLTVGAEMALWNPLLLRWVSGLRAQFPELVIQAETAMAEHLLDKLARGTLDIAIVHRVEYAPGFQVEQLMEEKLILVGAAQADEPYVYVDWGPEFRRQHDAALPGHARSPLSIDFGPLALQYLLRHGGSGYFRTRVVSSHLQSGALRRIPHAPEFSYPVYLIYSKQHHSSALDDAIGVLRRAAHDNADGVE
jgi:DNA-binding transcriptional LysR family regulator